ncbi:MAG: cyclic-di-AMP receptor [Clostridia bacterium]|nr:cyclic-di-AMP receptor [Clostridia bacterium]
MKMLTAIVQAKDTADVCQALSESGIEFTKMATSGGFLRSGNTTLLIGLADERVDEAIEIIRKNCRKRMEKVPAMMTTAMPMAVPHTAEVAVGGAIVFVTDVVRFEKM